MEKQLIPEPVCAAFKYYTNLARTVSTLLPRHKLFFNQDKPKTAPLVPILYTHIC